MTATWTDPGFGSLYGCEPCRPAYVTDDGTRVWMWRRGQRVRFYDIEGNQVGPQHANVVPAIVWAASQGWFDPTDPFLSFAVTQEVRRDSRHRATHEPWDESNPDAGAWHPIPERAS